MTSFVEFSAPTLAILISFFTILLYNLGGIGEIYKFSPEYGMGVWEINCLFLVIIPALIMPFLYHQSYKGMGEKLTTILRMVSSNGLHTGNA